MIGPGIRIGGQWKICCYSWHNPSCQYRLKTRYWERTNLSLFECFIKTLRPLNALLWFKDKAGTNATVKRSDGPTLYFGSRYSRTVPSLVVVLCSICAAHMRIAQVAMPSVPSDGDDYEMLPLTVCSGNFNGRGRSYEALPRWWKLVPWDSDSTRAYLWFLGQGNG